MHRRQAVLLVVALLVTTHLSQAQAESFSDRGRVMLDGQIEGYWSNDKDFAGKRTFADWRLSVWPGVTYFVIDRLGVGVSGGAGFERQTYETYVEKRLTAGGGAHALYDVRVHERVSLVPRLACAWLRERSDRADNPADLWQGQNAQGSFIQTRPPFKIEPIERDFFRLEASLPVAFHLSSSVVIGLGPFVTFDRLLRKDVYLPFGQEGKRRLAAGGAVWLAASF